jgi:hypothetical protein
MRWFIARWLILMTFALQMTLIFSTSQPLNSALGFAKQAGAIAGVAQACGQDITVLNERVKEVIQKLADNETEQRLALNMFYTTTQIAQRTQQKAAVVECRHARTALERLPLLQLDYEKNVLEKLN